jgi:hypothetical protein
MYPTMTIAEYLDIPLRGTVKDEDGVPQRFDNTKPKVNSLNSYLLPRYNGVAEGWEGHDVQSWDINLLMCWVTE